MEVPARKRPGTPRKYPAPYRSPLTPPARLRPRPPTPRPREPTGPGAGTDPFGKAGQQRGIDPVGLGQLPGRFAEIVDRTGVGHHDREAGGLTPHRGPRRGAPGRRRTDHYPNAHRLLVRHYLSDRLAIQHGRVILQLGEGTSDGVLKPRVVR